MKKQKRALVESRLNNVTAATTRYPLYSDYIRRILFLSRELQCQEPVEAELFGYLFLAAGRVVL